MINGDKEKLPNGQQTVIINGDDKKSPNGQRR